MAVLKDVITKKSRRVWHCPPHFIKVPLNDDKAPSNSLMTTTTEEKITTVRNWLFEHIENRFFVGPAVTFVNGLLVNEQIIGFENPADATYFTLLKPQLFSE